MFSAKAVDESLFMSCPMNNENLKAIIIESFQLWGNAVLKLSHQPIEPIIKAIETIDQCSGRVIVSGMGKSGHIGRKITASFTSIGKSAIFLHPAEALHGDIGVLNRDDVMLAISKSGFGEIVQLIPYCKRLGVQVIALTSNLLSPLAIAADIVLDCDGGIEAGPLDSVPTTSAITTLAIGDAILIGLIAKKGIKPEDFAILHPAGAIGKKLLLRVEDLMLVKDKVPIIPETSTLMDAILKMTANRGITSIVKQSDGSLIGVLTDGDLRRLLDHDALNVNVNITEVMNKSPKTIAKNQLAVVAVKEMGDFKITALFVLNDKNKPIGIIHLHDLMAAGVV
jgi:arabinose-5-phosphate isomerase